MANDSNLDAYPNGERESVEMEVEQPGLTRTTPVVLLVDDDAMVRDAHSRILRQANLNVLTADSAPAALALLTQSVTRVDAIVSDIIVPGMDGVQLLTEVRRHNLDIPVVLVTGNPQLDTAIAAVNHGGFKCLTKPIDRDEFVATVSEAVSLHRLARLKRQAMTFLQSHRQQLGDRASLDPTSALAQVAHRVVLEVTERGSLDQVTEIREKVAQLRALGYRIAIDDLGAGYSGLTSFSQLRPEYVKLDMSLIRGIDTSSRQQSLVRAMIAVCISELDVEVVCEGVETESERDTLEHLGALLLQGYYFGRPECEFASVPLIDTAEQGVTCAVS